MSDSVERAIDSLVGDPAYVPSGNITHCNEFIRDVVRIVLGENYSGLQGQVRDQILELRSSSDWIITGENMDDARLETCLATAYGEASSDKIVIVAWLNPTATSTNTGHIAIISSFLPMESSGKWGMKVPYIAHAGSNPEGVLRQLISFGFQKSAKNQLAFFEYAG